MSNEQNLMSNLDQPDPNSNHFKSYDNYTYHNDPNDVDNGKLVHNDNLIAVQIDNVCLSYGTNIVLNGINMNVPMKKIYGLLGPSGCGIKIKIVKFLI